MKPILEYLDFPAYGKLTRREISEPLQGRQGKASVQAPTISGHKELHALFPHIWSFENDITERTTWSDTVKKALFGNTLNDNARMRWNECAPALNEAGTVRTLEQALLVFAYTYVSVHSDARFEIIDYLRTAKKPENMSVKDFAKNMENMANAAEWFQGNSNVLNNTEFKVPSSKPCWPLRIRMSRFIWTHVLK